MHKFSLENVSSKVIEFVAEFGDTEYEFRSPKLGKLIDFAAENRVALQDIGPSGDYNLYAKMVLKFGPKNLKEKYKTHKEFLDDMEKNEEQVLVKCAVCLLGMSPSDLEKNIADTEKKVQENINQ